MALTLIKAQTYLMHNKKYMIVLAVLVSAVITVVIATNSFTTLGTSATQEVSYSEAKLIYSEKELMVFSDDVPDFTSYTDVNQKKKAFFDFLLPGIHNENQRVRQERSRLLSIQQRFISDALQEGDLDYARQLGESYHSALAKEGITPNWLSEMLLKVNVLPKALVLSQAANESAWGTSRFATKGNNYFGQWCYKAGCGLVPLQRAAGATHEVAKFNSASESVHGYFMNVNRNRAYHSLRTIRAKLEKDGKDLLSTEAAIELTNGLLHYSERGQDYVNELQAMIRANNKFWSDTKS